MKSDYISREDLKREIRRMVDRKRDIGLDGAIMHYLDVIDLIDEMPEIDEVLSHVEYSEAECGREK